MTLKSYSPKYSILRFKSYLLVISLTLWFSIIALPVWGIEIIAFGDSITAGTGSTSGGYPSQLQQIIQSKGKSCTIYNFGIPGERTYQGVERIDEVLDTIPADIILIMEGTNDIRSHHPWQTTKLNLQIMIDKAKAKGVTPILSTLTPSDQAHSEVLIPNRYNPMIKELAETNNIPLVDHYSAIEKSWASLNDDGIHPNDNGYLYLANTWNASIDKMISKKGEFINPNRFHLLLPLASIFAGFFLFFIFRKKITARIPSSIKRRRRTKKDITTT